MMSEKRYSHVHKEKIHLRADLGATLYDCQREAIIMAMEEDCPVVLTHNDKHYLADPKDMADIVEMITST